MNESTEPSPSPDAVKEEMTVMTEPDDKQSTGISPDTPREEAVSHVTEDIPLQPEPFLPESDGPEEYEDYSAYQELMNNENPEHLQENSDMPSQPDTGPVQADESELQATTATIEPAVRDEPTPQQPVQSTSPSDNTSSFLDKARGLLRVKRIHRRMRTVIPRPQRKPRRLHRYLTVLSTPRNVLMHRYRSTWTKFLKSLTGKNEQTEPSCTNWMANLPSLTG